MAAIRAFTSDDLNDVASMFQRLFRKNGVTTGDDLRSYLQTLFLDGEEQLSQVHLREDGSVSAFMGVLAVPMQFNGRDIKAAVCTSFISDDRGNDPFAGARLLRAVLAGPQDMVFGETADDVSLNMWRTMGAQALTPYSLEWLRVLRPCSFGLETLATRTISALRAAKPVSAMLDRMIANRTSMQAWSHFAPTASNAQGYRSVAASDEDLADVFQDLVQSFPLRPVWSKEAFLTMLQHSKTKALLGEPTQCIVKNRNGRDVGLFVFHGDHGMSGHTLQIVARPGLEPVVIDQLLRTAYAQGLVAIRGRTQPNLLQAMIGKKIAFLHTSSTVFHARDPELLKSAAEGTAFLNGFSGESWTRLIGDSFA